MIETIKAWSITRLFEFERCRFAAYLRGVKKSPQPELDDKHPMIRGSRIHKEVEQYINGEVNDFPSSGKKLKDVIDRCKKAYNEGNATVEEQWAFDADWNPADWYGDTTWARMATDCTIISDDTAEIFDWKTGKSFGNEVKYMQQMQLYACGGFLLNPEVNYIDVSLGFLDDGKLRTKNFERGAKINKLIARFTERGNRMTNCVDFTPNPSAVNCRWCPYGPSGTKACTYGVAPL